MNPITHKLFKRLAGRGAELHPAASQILNPRALKTFDAREKFHALPNTIRRYSRVQFCATLSGPTKCLRRLSFAISLAFFSLLTGCRTVGTPSDLVRGKGYQPQNIYSESAALPKNIRRVVVLPLVCDENDAVADDGRVTLEPVLVGELIKTKKFEVVESDGAFLKNRAGRADWSSEETLPPGFFALLRENSACDAVLFARLTVYRAYPPLEIGWRLRLVNAENGQTIWAADEVFNGGEPSVKDGARRHQLIAERDLSGAPDEWFVQNSPAKFGQYTAASLFATLPAR